MRTRPAHKVRFLGVLISLAILLALPANALQNGKKQKANQFRATTNEPLPMREIHGVDEALPPVEPDTDCSLSNVLRRAGRRVSELVDTLQQFTATEKVEHREADKAGNWRAPEVLSFEYLAELRDTQRGMLVMEELRNGTASPAVFPARLADIGLPAMAFVFHPYFVNDYDMRCEGRGQWEGKPAWQVYFQQRPDREARLRAYHVADRGYAVKLKGRAWIAADSYQVVHLETDLVEPISKIRLNSEHLSIDYDPVLFKKRGVELWLPNTADVYMSFQGHVFHRRHSFSNFLLFGVDVSHRETEPEVPQ
ncbi:MAG: hypothetical protein ACR2IF_07415 [Terriglobales bacterium]